jgi:DNA-binding PadR family transcriptional regulator
MHPRRGRRFHATRSRWRSDRGWEVRARVERFVEPALLSILAEGPVHGYDLLDRLPRVTGSEGGLDLGNLYRVLRALEADGLVRSDWHSELPGPAKRVYELTDDGRTVLDLWREALRRLRCDIDDFLQGHEGRR